MSGNELQVPESLASKPPHLVDALLGHTLRILAPSASKRLPEPFYLVVRDPARVPVPAFLLRQSFAENLGAQRLLNLVGREQRCAAREVVRDDGIRRERPVVLRLVLLIPGEVSRGYSHGADGIVVSPLPEPGAVVVSEAPQRFPSQLVAVGKPGESQAVCFPKPDRTR